jgi:capsid protein
MRKIDAEQEIIREWEALHDSQRQTERHAAMFAMAIKDKYPFSYDGDRYQAIKAIIAKNQTSKRLD